MAEKTVDNSSAPAARLYEQGKNIKHIQKQLGHASIQTTLDRYGHLIEDINSEQPMKLGAILGLVEHSGSSLNSVKRVLENE